LPMPPVPRRGLWLAARPGVHVCGVGKAGFFGEEQGAGWGWRGGQVWVCGARSASASVWACVGVRGPSSRVGGVGSVGGPRPSRGLLGVLRSSWLLSLGGCELGWVWLRARRHRSSSQTAHAGKGAARSECVRARVCGGPGRDSPRKRQWRRQQRWCYGGERPGKRVSSRPRVRRGSLSVAQSSVLAPLLFLFVAEALAITPLNATRT
jgi:hypothetical protein